MQIPRQFLESKQIQEEADTCIDANDGRKCSLNQTFANVNMLAISTNATKTCNLWDDIDSSNGRMDIHHQALDNIRMLEIQGRWYILHEILNMWGVIDWSKGQTQVHHSLLANIAIYVRKSLGYIHRKISRPQLQHLKEGHLEDFEAPELQKMFRLWDSLLFNLLHVHPVKSLRLRLSDRSIIIILHSDLNLHPSKLMTLILFEDEGYSITVTSDRYVEILRTFRESILKDRGSPDVWFQQVGATTHTTRRFKKDISKTFDLLMQ